MGNIFTLLNPPSTGGSNLPANVLRKNAKASDDRFRGFRYFLPDSADTSGAQVTNNSGNACWFDSSGRIVIGGEISIGGKLSVAVCRVLSSGIIDTSFGTNGWFTLVQAGGDYLQGMCIQSDGKIVCSGWFNNSNAFVLRLTTAGVLDTSFNSGGSIPGVNTFQPSGTSGQAIAFGVCQDTSSGKLVATGKALRTSDNMPLCFFTRFNTNGTVDTSYNTTGTVSLQGPTAGSLGWNVICDSQGRYVAGGQGAVSFSTTVATGSGAQNTAGQNLLNLTSLGTLPAGIQAGMGLTVDTAGNQESVTVLSLAGNVATLTGNLAHTHSAGAAVVAATNSTMFIARATSAGAMDTTFNGTGWNQVFSQFFLDGLTIAQQSNGSYIVGGQRVLTGSFVQQCAIARFKTDGTQDTSFGNTGSTGLTVYNPPGLVNALVTQSDDRILIAPASRLLPNGQLDLSFGGSGIVTPEVRTGAGTWWASNGAAVTSDKSTIAIAGRGVPVDGTMSFSLILLDAWGNAKDEATPKSAFITDPALPATSPANGASTVSSGAFGGRQVWAQIMGDGSTTQFTINHALGTEKISVEGHRDAGGLPTPTRVHLGSAANPVDLLGSALVNFTTAPAAGTKIHIKVTA